MRRRRALSRFAVSISAVAALSVGLLFANILWSRASIGDLNEGLLRFDHTALELSNAIGFAGLINDFKNCVLRPAEPGYCARVQPGAARAEALVTELVTLGKALDQQIELPAMQRMIRAYAQRADTVAAMHADGQTIREIDAAVRYDDSPATEELTAIQMSTRAAAEVEIARIETRFLIQSAAIAAGFLVICGGLSVWLRETQILGMIRQDMQQLVLDTATNGIMGIDRFGRVIFINPAARHMLGGLRTETPFDWPGTAWFLEPETLSRLDPTRDPVERALAGEALRGEVHPMRRATSDARRHVRMASARFSVPGRAEDVTVIVMDDVSEEEKKKRQHVEQARRLDALGQLTAGVAHDFNNLLATATYALSLSRRAEVPDKVRRDLEVAESALRRGSELTERLLSFGKTRPGNARTHSVAAVFDDLKSLLERTIERTIRLDFAEPGDRLRIFCDPGQLENALLNIVLNSRDAIVQSGKGDRIELMARALTEGEVTLDTGADKAGTYSSAGIRRERSGSSANTHGEVYRYVEIAVSDNGPGMPAEVRRRATDPFFTTKPTGSGTGLGLSMVYGFVQQSGGELRLNSEVGVGTTVLLRLPMGAADAGREPPRLRPPLTRGNGETVLLVEDERSLRDMTAELIRALDMVPVTAGSGREALRLVDKGAKFDVLLTDIVMPDGMSGFDLAREVRRRRPAVPVVYVSGYTGYSAAEMQDATGPLLQKPCDPEELADTLRAVLTAPAVAIGTG